MRGERESYYIGRPLQHLMAERGLTQYDVAAAAKMPQAYVSQLVADRKQPSVGVLRALEEGLGLEVGELYRQAYPESDRILQKPRPLGRPRKG